MLVGSRQVHLPRKQRFINQKCHQYVTSESIGYRSYGSQTDPIKQNTFFILAAFVLILLYGCSTWKLTKRIEKKLDGDCTRMLRTRLNKSWKQHPTKQHLYGQLPPISKII